MSAPIGPGDWVECINAMDFPDIVRVGGLYLVEETGAVRDVPTLVLRGVRHPLGYRHVRAECFRPIYRPRPDFTETLKQPAPERELEDA